MLEGKSRYRFSKECSILYNNVRFVIHEAGINVYDNCGNLIGGYPTEDEAVEMLRENSSNN